MAIAMDAGKVEAAKQKVDAVVEAFSSALDTARAGVDDLFGDRGLEGEAGNAFRARFGEADQTFRTQVIPQIEGIGQMLNAVKDGLEQSDLSIAQNIGGGG